MKSPCLTCPLRDKSKDNGVCETCPSRIKYVAYIEGAEHMIPTNKEPQQIKPPSKIEMPPAVSMTMPKFEKELRQCIECGKKGPGDKLFRKVRGGHFSKICKECFKERIRKAIATKKSKPKFGDATRFPRKAPQKPAPKYKTCRRCGATGPPGELFAVNVNSNDGYYHICRTCTAKSIEHGHEATKVPTGKNVIQLDLPEDLLGKLITMAAAQLRTPENMIMWLIKTYDLCNRLCKKLPSTRLPEKCGERSKNGSNGIGKRRLQN